MLYNIGLTYRFGIAKFNTEEEIESLAGLIRKDFGESQELFVHSDGCKYFQCHLCDRDNCPVRKPPFKQETIWTIENALENRLNGEKSRQIS